MVGNEGAAGVKGDDRAHAVLPGRFYGADTRTFMRGVLPVSAEEYALVMTGRTRYCLGGSTARTRVRSCAACFR